MCIAGGQTAYTLTLIRSISMSIYKLTQKEFDKTNRSLSKALDVKYQHIQVGDREFQIERNGLGGSTKGTTGYKFTEEQRKKMSLAQKGRQGTFLGKKHTEETKQKLSVKRTGKKISEMTREKMKNDGRRGRKHTEETKEKLRQAQLNFRKNLKLPTPI